MCRPTQDGHMSLRHKLQLFERHVRTRQSTARPSKRQRGRRYGSEEIEAMVSLGCVGGLTEIYIRKILILIITLSIILDIKYLVVSDFAIQEKFRL
jgi:hypothetical protein